jgi:uncharacterized protein
VANVILDTGPLVALFKRNDHHHRQAVEWFRRNKARLLTTLPVLTETWHLLTPHARPVMTAFATRALAVPDLGDDALQRIQDILVAYDDRLLDFTDATLVLLAERTGERSIATIDVRDFASLAPPSGRRFWHAFR